MHGLAWDNRIRTIVGNPRTWIFLAANFRICAIVVLREMSSMRMMSFGSGASGAMQSVGSSCSSSSQGEQNSGSSSSLARSTCVGAGCVSRVSGLVLGWSDAAEVEGRMVHNRIAGVRAPHWHTRATIQGIAFLTPGEHRHPHPQPENGSYSVVFSNEKGLSENGVG